MSESKPPSTAPISSGGGAGPVDRVLHVVTAVGVAVGGGLHLQIWADSKRDIPSQVPGVWVVQEGFLANVAISAVVAIAVVAAAFVGRAVLRRGSLVAALAVQLGSIAALVASRGSGVFGWSEKGWDADAKQVLTGEIVTAVLAVVALAWSFRRVVRSGDKGAEGR